MQSSLWRHSVTTVLQYANYVNEINTIKINVFIQTIIDIGKNHNLTEGDQRKIDSLI